MPIFSARALFHLYIIYIYGNIYVKNQDMDIDPRKEDNIS